MNTTASPAPVTRRRSSPQLLKLDYGLLGVAVALLALGVVMVASASLAIADRNFTAPFHYLQRHGIAVALGLCAAAAAFASREKRFRAVALVARCGAMTLMATTRSSAGSTALSTTPMPPTPTTPDTS